MSVGKVGKMVLTLNRLDAEIENHKREIIRLQRERVKASIDHARAIREESERRSAAIKEARAQA